MLAADYLTATGEHRDVLQAYRMFAHDKGWVRRMEASIESGLAAEVAVEKEQSATRARMRRVADPYLRERLHDLDDLSNRLLRLLAGVDQAQRPRDARERDPGRAQHRPGGAARLWPQAARAWCSRRARSAAMPAIVARALAIPLVIQAAAHHPRGAERRRDPGRRRPWASCTCAPRKASPSAFREKIDMRAEAQQAYAALRDKPATTRDGVTLQLYMNAGLMADLPSACRNAARSASGSSAPSCSSWSAPPCPSAPISPRSTPGCSTRAGEKPVTFRTLDIGSDKVLPYMKRQDEPNPALGWRAIRVGLDRPGIMRMQVQALLRGAKGRPLHGDVPLRRRAGRVRGGARGGRCARWRASRRSGAPSPPRCEIGAMLETPSLAFAPGPVLRADRFPLDRRQRPEAVLLRRRPRERAGAPALRHPERQLPRLPRAYRARAAPRTARRCRSAARMPAGRSRRWRSPRSACASSRCARPRSARSRR